MWNQASSSHICSEIWKRKERDLHLERLRSAKPSIDTRAPRTMSLKKNRNAKRERILEEKNFSIQRDNKLLLKKMLQIDVKQGDLNPHRIMGRRPSQSLNRSSRIKDLMRITEENRALLKRLRNAQSHYDKMKWDDERRYNEYLVNRICQNSGKVNRNWEYIIHASKSNNTIDPREWTGREGVNHSFRGSGQGTLSSGLNTRRSRPMSAPNNRKRKDQSGIKPHPPRR